MLEMLEVSSITLTVPHHVLVMAVTAIGVVVGAVEVSAMQTVAV